MRQSIERKWKTAMSEAAITVTFRGSSAGFEGAESSLARGRAVPTLRATLRMCAIERSHFNHVRTPTKSALQKFYAEPLRERSAELRSEINSYVGGNHAALITINQKTEQHRCVAV